MAGDGDEEDEAAVMPVSTEEIQEIDSDIAKGSQLPDPPSNTSTQLEFKQSNFNEYTSSTTYNKDDPNRAQRRAGSDTFSTALEDAFSEEAGDKKEGSTEESGWFSIDRFKPYFNVDTDEVLLRLRAPFLPFGYSPAQEEKSFAGPEELFLDTSSTPDLYGPVWVSVTIVFLLTAVGQYKHRNSHNYFKEAEKLVLAATLIWGYLAITPLVYVFVARYQKVKLALIRLYVAYGYSYVTFIPALLLCLPANPLFGWSVTMIASVLGGLFVARTTYSTLSKGFADRIKQCYITIGGFFCAHLFLGMILRINFFNSY